jgi:MFS transporter, DHA2 family, multidrug resistance protein
MMRNTGSAIGISLVTNLLNSHEQIHQANLSNHFTVFEAWRLDQAAPIIPGASHTNLMHGLVTGQLQGFGAIYQTLQQQASLMAYNDVYRWLAIMSALCVPSFLLLRKFRGGAAAGH